MQKICMGLEFSNFWFSNVRLGDGVRGLFWRTVSGHKWLQQWNFLVSGSYILLIFLFTVWTCRTIVNFQPSLHHISTNITLNGKYNIAQVPKPLHGRNVTKDTIWKFIW
jgi:hypothetical protein